MNINECVNGKLYWIEYNNHIYMSKYTNPWDRSNGWFDFFGTDESTSMWDVVTVLGEVEYIIPDYIDRDKLA